MMVYFWPYPLDLSYSYAGSLFMCRDSYGIYEIGNPYKLSYYWYFRYIRVIKVTYRINFPSLNIYRQKYHTVLMYGIILVDTSPSDNILTFARSCHEMDWHLYKYITNSFNFRESVSVETKLYTYEILAYCI